MIVPSDLRDVVGQREIRESLKTTSSAEARLLCALKQVEWTDRFEAVRQQRASAVAAEGVRIVDEHRNAQIIKHGAFHAVAYEFELIAHAEHAHLDDPGMLEPGQAAADLCPSYAEYTDPCTRELIEARQRASTMTSRLPPSPVWKPHGERKLRVSGKLRRLFWRKPSEPQDWH